MSSVLDKKNIPISAKRQITIPIKFFKALEFESELECIFTGEEIILRPSRNETGYFAQEILNDLIDSGYEGNALKEEFAKRSTRVKPAVKKMLEDVSVYAKKAVKDYKDETADIFDMGEK